MKIIIILLLLLLLYKFVLYFHFRLNYNYPKHFEECPTPSNKLWFHTEVKSPETISLYSNIVYIRLARWRQCTASYRSRYFYPNVKVSSFGHSLFFTSVPSSRDDHTGSNTEKLKPSSRATWSWLRIQALCGYRDETRSKSVRAYQIPITIQEKKCQRRRRKGKR